MHLPKPARSAPKKSVTVRFPVPRASASTLRSMAISKDPRLLELGVLAVQIRDNESIVLGIGLEKQPWQKKKELRGTANIRGEPRQVVSRFDNGVDLRASKANQPKTAVNQLNTRDIIYATQSNGVCSNNTAVEKPTSQLRLGGGTLSSAIETRSPTFSGIQANLSGGHNGSDLHSVMPSSGYSSHQSGIPPGRLLPPLPRRNKRDDSSPASDASSSNSELEDGDVSPQQMFDILFDGGRFSAAHMLMQMAKNYSSKEGSESPEEGRKLCSNSKNATSASTSSAAHAQTSVNPQSRETKLELMHDDESKSSEDSSIAIVHLSSASSANSVKFEHSKPTTATKTLSSHGISPNPRAANGSSAHTPSGISSSLQTDRKAGTNAHTPICNGISASLQTDGKAGQTHANCADTRTTWLNSSICPNSQQNVNTGQTIKGTTDTLTTWSDSGVSSYSQTADGRTRQTHTDRADNPNSQPHLNTGQTPKGNADTQTTWSNPGVSPTVVSAPTQFGFYQQNVSRYPLGYVTYPLGFVYPYVALPQGVNIVNKGENKGNDQVEKKMQSGTTSPETSGQGVAAHSLKQEEDNTKGTEGNKLGDSAKGAQDKNVSTVQWLIPQVQTGNAIQQGQFIDLARYWQQLSLLYRSQLQTVTAHKLAGNLQYATTTTAVTSNPATVHQNATAIHAERKEMGNSVGRESCDVNNNVKIDCDKPARDEVSARQTEGVDSKSNDSLISFEANQLSLKQRLEKSRDLVDKQEFKSTSDLKTERVSVIHAVEPYENKHVSGTRRNMLGSSDQPLWKHSTNMSENPSKVEGLAGSSKSYPSSVETSSSEGTGSPAPDGKELFPAWEQASNFQEAKGIRRGVSRGSTPELSFVHENSIAYINVRSYSDYGTNLLKKSGKFVFAAVFRAVGQKATE